MRKERYGVNYEVSRCGICEWVLPVWGTDAVHMAADYGFEGIQIIEQGGYKSGFPLSDKKVQDAYKRVVEETGILLQALHLWDLCRQACMIHPIDSEPGKLGIQSIKEGIEACVSLKIPALNLTSGFMSQIKHERDFEIFAQHLKIACEMAGEKGVRIVFESALTADEILMMCSLVGPDLKICYDIFNPVRFCMNSPWEEIPILGRAGVIDHFHVKDGPANCVGCTLLGEGIGMYEVSMKAVRALGFKGWFMMENYYVDMAAADGEKRDVRELAAIDLASMKEVFKV